MIFLIIFISILYNHSDSRYQMVIYSSYHNYGIIDIFKYIHYSNNVRYLHITEIYNRQ